MPIGTGAVKLSEIINEFGDTTYGPKNVKAYHKCAGITTADISSTPGTGSVTAPAGATRVRIKVWGAGGGGGRGSFNGTENFGGGGGGGGAHVIETMPVIGGVTTFNWTVGAGGAGGTTVAQPGNGGDSTVTGAATLTAGGGIGGINASGDEGTGGAGGTASGGDTNLNGFAGGDAGGPGGSSPDGGTGGSGRVGSNPGNPGTAPGGGGGGNYANISGVSANGGAGGNGKVEFVWYGAGVAEHENNSTIPFTGTLKFSNFRSAGSNIVSKDFESDTYTGRYTENFIQGPGGGQQGQPQGEWFLITGLHTTAASQLVQFTWSIAGGTKGSVDVIGRSISGQGETSILNSIFDYRYTEDGLQLFPNNCVLVLNGDMRVSNWDIPWTEVSVTLNNSTVTRYRRDSLVSAGSYDSTKNLTYWTWSGSFANPAIFGFINGDTNPYNFTCRVSII